MNVAHELVVEGVLRGDDDHGHLLVDKCDGAVLHLGGRIAFRVDIADFLQLQRPFQGDRVVVATAQIQEVAGIGEYLGYLMDFLVAGVKQLFLFLRDVVQLLYQLLVLADVDGAAGFGDGERQHRQDGHLTRERLCGCHTNLRTYVDVASGLGGTRNGGSDGIADTEDECSLFLGQLHSCQCVGGLSRLGYGDDHVLVVDYGIAVAELRGIFHLHGNLAEVLQQLLANQSGVPACSAGHDDEPPCVDQLLPVVDDSRQHHVV